MKALSSILYLFQSVGSLQENVKLRMGEGLTTSSATKMCNARSTCLGVGGELIERCET